MRHEGESVRPRHRTAGPAPCLQAVAPERAGLVVAVAGLGPWSWLAALGVPAGLPCVLGPALSRRARPGGPAQHAQLDAPKMAPRRRGGRLPPAEVDPAARRATRDRRRRRRPLRRHRAERFSPGHHPPRPSHRPEIGPHRAATAHRGGGAARWAEAAGHQPLAGALARSPAAEERRRDRDRSLLHPAQPHAAHPLARRHPVPGRGPSLSRVRLDAIQARARFPRGQAVVSSWRLVQGAQASAGQRWGRAGQHSGHAPRPGAGSEAAAVCWRHTPHGQPSLGRWANTPATGTARTILAPKLAPAVSARLPRHTAGDRARGRRPDASRAGEPEVARDTQGKAPASRGLPVLVDGVLDRHGVPRGPGSRSLPG